MPLDIQNAQLPPHPMPPEHLQRHDRRILQPIADHFPVENLQGPVIAPVHEQRERGVEFHRSNSFRVVSQSFVWRAAEIEIVPE